MGKAGDAIVSVIGSFIGVAILAVLVAKNSQTSTVIQSFGSGIANILSAALSPVTGAQTTVNTGASSPFGGTSVGTSVSGIASPFSSSGLN